MGYSEDVLKACLDTCRRNKNNIRAENFSALYDDFYSYRKNELTAFLINCKIDINYILENFDDDIPSHFLDTALISNNKLKPKRIVIPGHIKAVNDYAFRGGAISSIIIQEGVESLGHLILVDKGASTNALLYLSIPDSVTLLPQDVIAHCHGTLIECNSAQADILMKGKRSWVKGTDLSQEERDKAFKKYAVVINIVR